MRSVPRWCAAISAAAGMAACLDVTMPAPTVDQRTDPRGYWVTHISGGPFDPYVELFQIQSLADTAAPLNLIPLPTRTWDGYQAPEVYSNAVVSAVDSHGVASWSVGLSGGMAGRLDVTFVGDTLRGGLWINQGTGDSLYPVVGFRISSLILPDSVGSPTLPGGGVDSTPLVLLRIDDNSPADAGLIQRMQARGLYGELGIPTGLVGLDGRPSWDRLDEVAREGFTPVAHSRLHAETAGSTLELLREVLGSLDDLAAHGHRTTVFIQPGTWEDSINFQNPRMLHNWRGALFRTFTNVFEAYAWGASVPEPLPESIAIGVGHETVSGFPKSDVMTVWRIAQHRGKFIVFLIHSYDVIPPDSLDWLFDSISAAVRAGRIRLAHTSADALGP